MLSTVVSFHVKENRTNQLHNGRCYLRRVAGPSSGSRWQIILHIYLYTCLEALLNCQCCSSFGVTVA